MYRIMDGDSAQCDRGIDSTLYRGWVGSSDREIIMCDVGDFFGR